MVVLTSQRYSSPFVISFVAAGVSYNSLLQEDDSIRRFRYLLGLTDLFRHFIETNPNPRIKEIMAEIDRQNDEEEAKAKKKGSSRSGGAGGDRRRRTEQEEDAELLKDEKSLSLIHI